MADRVARMAAVAYARKQIAALGAADRTEIAELLYVEAERHNDWALAKALEYTDKMQGVDDVYAELDRLVLVLDAALGSYWSEHERELVVTDARRAHGEPIPEWLQRKLAAEGGQELERQRVVVREQYGPHRLVHAPDGGCRACPLADTDVIHNVAGERQ